MWCQWWRSMPSPFQEHIYLGQTRQWRHLHLKVHLLPIKAVAWAASLLLMLQQGLAQLLWMSKSLLASSSFHPRNDSSTMLGPTISPFYTFLGFSCHMFSFCLCKLSFHKGIPKCFHKFFLIGLDQEDDNVQADDMHILGRLPVLGSLSSQMGPS